MNKYKLNYVITFLFILMLLSCADGVTFEEAALIESVGFWYGLWHGMTVGFSFIGQLFSGDIAIYAIYNNGIWYDFGFVIGIGLNGGIISLD